VNGETGRKRKRNGDIEERTLRFAVSVVRLAQILESGHGVSSVIGKQILRAGTSIGANLHEAKGSQSRANFISKCSIACKEAHETLYWLDLLVASNLMEERELTGLAQECDELVAILTTIVKKSKDHA